MIDTLAIMARGGGTVFNAPANALSSLAAVHATHFYQPPSQ